MHSRFRAACLLTTMIFAMLWLPSVCHSTCAPPELLEPADCEYIPQNEFFTYRWSNTGADMYIFSLSPDGEEWTEFEFRGTEFYSSLQGEYSCSEQPALWKVRSLCEEELSPWSEIRRIETVVSCETPETPLPLEPADCEYIPRNEFFYYRWSDTGAEYYILSISPDGEGWTEFEFTETEFYSSLQGYYACPDQPALWRVRSGCNEELSSWSEIQRIDTVNSPSSVESKSWSVVKSAY